MLSVAELKELEIQNDVSSLLPLVCCGPVIFNIIVWQVLWEAELNELDARVGSYDFETSSLH